MDKKVFYFLFFAILLFALLERLIPVIHNNFYFTMDQGNDAVHVREILERHQILLRGPETGINGLYAGPLWYYFLSIGYKLFDGHPSGAIFMLILLNVALTAIIMLIVAKNVSKSWGIIIGATLQISWWFYNTSRYAFNPFVLVFLSFLLIFALTDFLKGKDKSFIFAGVFVGLGFHAEVAGSMALLLFYLLIGLWSRVKRHTPLSIFLGGMGVVFLFFIPHILSEIQSGLGQTYSLLRELKHPQGAFSSQLLIDVTKHLLQQISQSTFYQNQKIGIIIFLTLISLTIKNHLEGKKLNEFVAHFLLLTTILTGVTWVFFSSNYGWRDWQTVYVYPLIFISVLLLLSQLKRKIALIFIMIIIVSHTTTFTERYRESFKISPDPSILANELMAIDWVYQKSDKKGFNVYSYLPSAVDYPYQYLFWWYGIKKYTYIPCDYSSYPGSPKPLYIPGSGNYENPKKECTNLRFLIIEPDKNLETREQWLKGTREGTQLLDQTYIGNILVEQRILPTTR